MMSTTPFYFGGSDCLHASDLGEHSALAKKAIAKTATGFAFSASTPSAKVGSLLRTTGSKF